MGYNSLLFFGGVRSVAYGVTTYCYLHGRLRKDRNETYLDGGIFLLGMKMAICVLV